MWRASTGRSQSKSRLEQLGTGAFQRRPGGLDEISVRANHETTLPLKRIEALFQSRAILHLRQAAGSQGQAKPSA